MEEKTFDPMLAERRIQGKKQRDVWDHEAGDEVKDKVMERAWWAS